MRSLMESWREYAESPRIALTAWIAAICLSGCSENQPIPVEAVNAHASDPEKVDQPTASPQPTEKDQKPSPSMKPSASMSGMGKMQMPNPADIRFKDTVESNATVPEGLDGLVFLDTSGKRVSLQGFLGEKNVVLVFTEGFAGGMLCPFCKTQTSRLVANYDKFAELDTEILVVYPGTRDHLDEFIAAAKKSEKAEVDSVPFPLLLDEDLKAVGYFNISSNLAHPSTFIIDKRGNVRLAYVGADMTADRPSVASMLKVLESTAQ